MSERKVHIVGSAGDFELPYQGKKSFGSRQILFQSSEFERKGGDILLQAFRLVRRFETCRRRDLVIVGSTLQIEEEGVTNLGYVAERARMEELFLASDLVVAPARCDPFTAFVIEAMNFRRSLRRDADERHLGSDHAGCRRRSRGMPRPGAHHDDHHPSPGGSAKAPARYPSKARQLVASQLNWAIVAETLAREIRALVPPSGDPTAGARRMGDNSIATPDPPAYNALRAILPRLTRLALGADRRLSTEIWVYDDCSKDDTAAVAQSLGAQVVAGDVNRGCSHGNVLASHTRCGWVHFHDADDELLPGFVETARKYADEERADVVLFGFEERRGRRADPGA